MTIEEMKRERCRLFKIHLDSWRSYKRCKKLFQSLEKRAIADESAYLKAEYELACLDGRKKVVEPEKQHKSRGLSLEDALASLTDEQREELKRLINLE